ncbi:MAG: nucleoside recognition protein [Eubacterium sp.]|jgi:spore maturation protein A|nr:nucleoside recognition protein [Eubacterium sp.]
MNYLWGFMIVIGIVFAAFNGTLPEVTEAAVGSAKEAVMLCIGMTGIMSFWVGIMRIAENAGMIEGATKKMMPFLRFLFPGIPREHPANRYIATNMIANVFGLGWAATPAGLKAMEALSELEEERREAKGRKEAAFRQRKAGGKARFRRKEKERMAVPKGVASNEMCTFLIINISSLQLISVNMLAYRSQYGSVNPSAVVGPGILATIVSTLAAVVYCKIMDRSQ